MTFNRTNSVTTPGTVRISLAILAVLAMTAALLLLGGTTAQAESGNGAVPNLRLSSASPGGLTISWDAPDPTPSDYRLIWAEQSLDFLSYSRPNEANRGNEYPGGDETSITLTGLTKGATFKVQARTRYTSGGNNNGPWSGPWTATVTARVQEDPPPEPQPTPASTPQPPSAPTGLTTSGVAHDSVTISWAAPSQGTVTSYRVMRGTETGSLSTIEEDTGNIDVEYTDSTVAAETTYYYAVLALSQDGDGAQSTTVSATTPAEALPVPSAPTGLTTYQVAHDSVTISWTTPSQGSVTGYRILRGTDSNSLSAIVQNTDSTATEYTDSTVTAETTYYYAVLALSAEGDGAQSAAVSATTPAAPQQTTAPDLRLSSTAAGQLTISWDAPDPTPSDYRIVWAKQDLDFPSYSAANEANRGNEYPSGDDTSINITGLSGGSTFKVKARARYTSGGDNNGPWSGPWTGTITARVKDDPPAAPTGLTAARVAHDSVILTWTSPSSGSTVTSYRILRGTDANSLSAIADDTGSTGTEYTDSTVAAETTYYYAVLALNQDGDGQQSDTARATTPAAPSLPSAPTGLIATPSHDRVSLSWDDPQNGSITGYQIWRGADATSLASIQADTGSAATTYVDDTVKAKTAYHYAVSAINSTGTSDKSTTVLTPTVARQLGTNNAPTASDSAVTTDEDTEHTFAASSFGYSDSDGDTLASVKITELPAAGKGTLTLDGGAITSSALPKAVTKAELDDGKFTYTPPANANGTGYASFKFKVNDGMVDSIAAYTMTINVTPVNDPATGTPTISGSAIVGYSVTAGISGIADVEGLSGRFTYQWKRYAADGTTFETNIGGNSSKYPLSGDEDGKKVKVEVTFMDNDGNSEGPLVSDIFPPTSTVTSADSVVVSNAGKAHNFVDLVSNNLWYAQAFCTGGSYTTLKQVRIYASDPYRMNPSVALHAGSVARNSNTIGGSTPPTHLLTLTNPTSYDASYSTPDDFTTTGYQLGPNTLYWIVIKKAVRADTGWFRVSATRSRQLDSGPADGWSLGRTLSLVYGPMNDRVRIAVTANTASPSHHSPRFPRSCEEADYPSTTRTVYRGTAANTVIATLSAADPVTEIPSHTRFPDRTPRLLTRSSPSTPLRAKSGSRTG